MGKNRTPFPTSTPTFNNIRKAPRTKIVLWAETVERKSGPPTTELTSPSPSPYTRHPARNSPPMSFEYSFLEFFDESAAPTGLVLLVRVAEKAWCVESSLRGAGTACGWSVIPIPFKAAIGSFILGRSAKDALRDPTAVDKERDHERDFADEGELGDVQRVAGTSTAPNPSVRYPSRRPPGVSP